VADSDKPDPSKALVKRAETRPAPPMVMAKSLAEAPPKSFVHVDGKGQVRSPSRYKALQAASYGAAGAIVAGVTVIYGAILGPAGIAVGLGLGAYVGWHIRRGLKLQEATRLLVHDRLDEAEAMINEVLKSWRLPKTMRALAEQNLAACYIRRGNFEEALKHQRIAMTLYARFRKKSLFARTVEYAEITTLVNLGRTGEARQRLEQKHGQVPEGDYLRMQHWVSELYVCLAEGEHRITADDLHERAHVALGITGAAALLGLCAWAHLQAGDTDQAWHLLREAFDRRAGVGLERALPRLHDWMERNAEAAGVTPRDPEDTD
jgi:tetratricopeptide (TPR) repeat protein